MFYMIGYVIDMLRILAEEFDETEDGELYPFPAAK